MIGSVTIHYALRDVLRHRTRSLLMIAGIAVGCAITAIATSYMSGALDMQVRAVAESGTGHLVVVPDRWVQIRDDRLRLDQSEKTLQVVRNQPGVEVAIPRAKAGCMLAFGNRSAAVMMTGVSADDEQKGNRVIRKSQIEGRYIASGEIGVVVIGKVLADRLDVLLHDQLVVTTAARTGISGAMLEIVGILRTGSREIDAGICHTTLAQMQQLTKRPGIGEIAVLLESPEEADTIMQTLQTQVPGDNQVISWKAVSPEFAAGAESDAAFSALMIGIILTMTALGIAAAQLTAVLQRRRELAVLAALGMSRTRVVGIVMVQALVIGCAGAAASLPIGLGVAWWLAYHGIPIGELMGGDASIGNVMLDPVLYGAFGPWLAAQALVLGVSAALVAAVYPAWTATRVDPAEAMRRL